MGILNKVFKHTNEEPDGKAVTHTEPECPHTSLTQHWDRLEDMGKAELATYRCESCFAEFSAEDAEALLEQPPEILAGAGFERHTKS